MTSYDGKRASNLSPRSFVASLSEELSKVQAHEGGGGLGLSARITPRISDDFNLRDRDWDRDRPRPRRSRTPPDETSRVGGKLSPVITPRISPRIFDGPRALNDTPPVQPSPRDSFTQSARFSALPSPRYSFQATGGLNNILDPLSTTGPRDPTQDFWESLNEIQVSAQALHSHRLEGIRVAC
jgi:hypothetical protein